MVAATLFDRPDVLGYLGYLTYAITGPMAMGAAIYALFTDG